MRSTPTLENLPALGAILRSIGPLVAILAVAVCGGDEAATDQAQQLVPAFHVDEAWPQLPTDWVMSSGLGLYVDSGDHVWVSHRAELIEPEHLAAAAQTPARAAPIVMELDASGQVVQGWEGELPGVLHGFFVDHNDFVWTTARDQHQIMKFTRGGELVLTIGRENETAGSN
ncbi:MAG TPA: hypothetical protein VMM35_11725, partial [Longimicrobiales bacterium]|nr:hypothetical protein [Longimicrobiales bacterium]